MILNVELCFKEMYDFLFFPGLSLADEVNQLFLLSFVELRRLAASEVRGEFPEAAFIPASNPVGGRSLRFPDIISSLSKGCTFVQPIDKNDAFVLLDIVCFGE